MVWKRFLLNWVGGYLAGLPCGVQKTLSQSQPGYSHSCWVDERPEHGWKVSP